MCCSRTQLSPMRYVALGPWRSEFYLMPPQSAFDLGTTPWYHTLALHEYRHVQQYNNFRKGLSRVAYYLFGQEGLAHGQQRRRTQLVLGRRCRIPGNA